MYVANLAILELRFFSERYHFRLWVFALTFYFSFYRYIITHTFKNIKTLPPRTKILRVPGKK